MEKKINILVIDDNEDDRVFIEKYIRETGDRNITIVSNAKQFADSMNKTVHIVVLDHVIVDQTGLDLIPIIKSRSDFPFIIIYTGYQDNNVTMNYLNTGANRIVGKWEKSSLGELDYGREKLKKYIMEGIEITKSKLEAMRDLRSLKSDYNE